MVFKLYRSRKYFQRILLSILLFMLVIMLLYATTLFYSSERTVLDMQYEANEKVLSQVEYNVTYMDELVSNMMNAMRQDSNIRTLMYDGELAMTELYPILQELSNTVSVSTFMDSVMVYNSNQDVFYSTLYYPLDPRIESNNRLFAELEAYMLEDDSSKSTKWVPINTGDSSIDYFSFIHFEDANRTITDQSALIINVKSNWLFENIDIINKIAENRASTVVLNQTGEVMNPSRLARQEAAQIESALAQHVARSELEMDSFIDNSSDDKRIMTYVTLDNGWRIVSVQPYEVALEKILKMRSTTIAVTVIFLIVAMIVSLVISQKLYNPIQKLISQVAPQEKLRNKDEIAYVMNVYSQVTEEMNLIKRDYDATRNPVKSYYIRRLLSHSRAMPVEEFTESITKHEVNVAEAGPYVLVQFTVEGAKSAEKSTGFTDFRLLSFAITNIAGEIMSKTFQNEIHDQGNGVQVAVMSLGQHREYNEEELAAVVKEVQSVISKFYRITLSAAISPVAGNYKEIASVYKEVQQYSKYRLVYGIGAILTPGRIEQHTAHEDVPLPSELERKLVEAIHLQDRELFEQTLQKMMTHLSEQSHDFILHAILNVVFLMKQTITELSKRKSVAVSPDLGNLNIKVLEQESLDKIIQLLLKTFDQLEQQQSAVEEDKNEALVEVIKEMIHDQYMDMNLSLQSVAAALGMSDKYIGRQFKKLETLSVSEYINEYRLSRAAKLLENESYTVKDIMQQVGIGNESHFFRLFKKKYGTTPREYRMNQK